MSEKKQLVFWPRVEQSNRPQFYWDDTKEEKIPTYMGDENSSTPEEGSDPESDAYYYMAETKVNNMQERLFKIIIIGDPTVGKTSYVQRYVQNTFRKDYKGTVGVDFALKILKWSEAQTVKLQLWDIAGQERFTWMTRVYYKDAHGCVIMFDLTNKNSFVNTLKWKRDVDTKCKLPDGSSIPCMLLANKCDLGNRQVDQMEIEVFYKQHNFIGWTETSPKEGLMVNDSMRFLVDVIMKQEGIQGMGSNDSSSDNLTLTGPALQAKKNCSC